MLWRSDPPAADTVRAFAEGTSLRAAYLYDAGGNRVKKIVRNQQGDSVVTLYIDGGFEPLYKLSSCGVVSDAYIELHVMDDRSSVAVRRVGNAFAWDNSPERRYNLEDHFGNSAFTVDAANSSLITREEYFPFGETSFGSYSKKRYRFCGKERDEESGLYYYGARYYAAWSCRFVRVDPLAGEMPFSSPYSYAANNPVVLVDVDGLAPGGGGGSPMPPPTGDPRPAGTASSILQGTAASDLMSGKKITGVSSPTPTRSPAPNRSGTPIQTAPLGFDSQGNLSTALTIPASDHFAQDLTAGYQVADQLPSTEPSLVGAAASAMVAGALENPLLAAGEVNLGSKAGPIALGAVALLGGVLLLAHSGTQSGGVRTISEEEAGGVGQKLGDGLSKLAEGVETVLDKALETKIRPDPKPGPGFPFVGIPIPKDEDGEPPLRIALGVDADLENFAAKVNAISYRDWGMDIPSTPAGYVAAVILLGNKTNVTFHFNLTTSSGRLDTPENMIIYSNKITTAEYLTVTRFFMAKTTFYLKSGTIYKPTKPRL